MRRVGIVSSGSTRFTRQAEELEDMMISSIGQVFKNANNLDQRDVEVVLTSTNANQKYLANIVSEKSGISPKIAHSVESLCNSGTNCIVSAFAYVASGLAETALIVGSEKMDSPGLVLDWDVSRGQYKHPIYWGSIFTSAHMRKFGTTMEDLAYVSAKNHRNGLYNPTSSFDRTFSLEDVMQSRNLTENVRLLDCSMPCNGAASVLIASEDAVKKFTDNPVWISGIGQKSISAGFTKNQDLSSLQSTKMAASEAFAMAHLEPSEIDVAELHDAFSICEIMALEDIGIVDRGMGSGFVKEMYETHDKKINPRGGLIGTGHPLGATGVAQTIEAFQQLQGIAGKRQVEGAKTALVHNMSAAATSSTVLVFQA